MISSSSKKTEIPSNKSTESSSVNLSASIKRLLDVWTNKPPPNWKPVAMKIVKHDNLLTFERECTVLTKLMAYKNKTVEQYGILAMWYKGDLLNKFYAIGMTQCETSIMDKKDKYGKLTSTDLMIVLYQVVSDHHNNILYTIF